jgi:hypothetical protein
MVGGLCLRQLSDRDGGIYSHPLLRSRNQPGYVTLIGGGIVGFIRQFNLYGSTFMYFETV